jgi:hypothetical protein
MVQPGILIWLQQSCRNCIGTARASRNDGCWPDAADTRCLPSGHDQGKTGHPLQGSIWIANDPETDMVLINRESGCVSVAWMKPRVPIEPDFASCVGSDTRCALQKDKFSQGIPLDEKLQERPKDKERAQTARH